MNKRELSANVKDALMEVMRIYVGSGEGKISYEDLAAQSGIPEGTLYDYNKPGTHKPNLDRFFALLSCLPASAADIMMRVIGLETHTIEGDVCYFEANAHINYFTGKLSWCLRDGVLDYRERLQLMPLADRASEQIDLIRAPRGNKVVTRGYNGVLNTRPM